MHSPTNLSPPAARTVLSPLYVQFAATSSQRLSAPTKLTQDGTSSRQKQPSPTRVGTLTAASASSGKTLTKTVPDTLTTLTPQVSSELSGGTKTVQQRTPSIKMLSQQKARTFLTLETTARQVHTSRLLSTAPPTQRLLTFTSQHFLSHPRSKAIMFTTHTSVTGSAATTVLDTLQVLST